MREARKSVVVTAPPVTWLIRLLWLTLPLTLGDLLARALEDRSAAVSITVAVLAWAVFAAGLACSLVALPATLIGLRLLAPLPLLAGVVAATEVTPGVLGWVGLGASALIVVGANAAEVGFGHINGAAYGDEVRFPLRTPALVAAVIPLVWAAAVVAPLGGILLLAARQWALGAVVVVLGVLALWRGVLSLLRLTSRWAVFVPAGMTLVDPLALVEPRLVRRGEVVRLGAAPSDTRALDLTAGATGLILQLDLSEELSVVPVARRGAVATPVAVTSLLVAPARPGALLAVARERGFATDTSGSSTRAQ